MSHSRATVRDVPKFLNFVSGIVPIGAVHTKLFFFMSSLYNISSIFSSISLLTHASDLLGEISWDHLRAPSGQAAAPGLLTECRGRSHLPPVVSLLIPSSSLGRRGQSVQNVRESQVFLAVAPGLVNECHGRGSPARFQGARAA